MLNQQTHSSTRWIVDRIVHFDGSTVVRDGFVHFGFHDKTGRQYVLEHQKHFLGRVGENGALEWTIAPAVVFDGVPNIKAEIRFPIYLDSMIDGTLLVSCFGNSRLYHVDPVRMEANLFVDGAPLGMKHIGNCIVDENDSFWLNEIEGCKVWKFDSKGRPFLTLGDGTPGFQRDAVAFDKVRFNWIYDMRPGPDGNIYVLDSRNFALRMIDAANGCVMTLAGTGGAGYNGDGDKATSATFGSDPNAQFDGPISLSLDELGNIFIGNRFNHVVRMVDSQTGLIETIAGRQSIESEDENDARETDPLNLRLPKISSMDYYNRRLYVPTDLAQGTGDLIVLKRKTEG